MTIECYLRELRRLLPSTRRRRFLAEAESHLRDAAAAHERDGLAPAAAEARAVAAFGPAVDVARSLAVESAVVALRRAAGAALLGLGALAVPLYGVPENALPPAPWADRPAYLGALLAVTSAAWLVAFGLAGLALVLSVLRRSAAAAVVLGAAGAGGVLAVLAGAATTIAWWTEVPGVPLLTIAALGGIAAVCALGLVLAAAVWALGRRPLLACAEEGRAPG